MCIPLQKQSLALLLSIVMMNESGIDVFEIYEGRERDEIVRQVLRMCTCLTSVGYSLKAFTSLSSFPAWWLSEFAAVAISSTMAAFCCKLPSIWLTATLT